MHESESGEHAGELVRRAVHAERCHGEPLIYHADNGSPMKASALQATLDALGVTASHSRPHVSNDNAYAESLFRTCKYRPDYPRGGFATLDDAQRVGAAVYALVQHHAQTSRPEVHQSQ